MQDEFWELGRWDSDLGRMVEPHWGILGLYKPALS